VQSVIASSPLDADDLATLQAIQRKVHWLSMRIVDAANHDRTDPAGPKIGGHQASCGSMVSIMTSLWFHHLRAEDLVSVKPHASPVLHAINYLLGALDAKELTRLRAFGGLQAYPSRTKDPDRVDFSTGSVGLGATAPLFAAAARRYIDNHFGARAPSRFVSLVGDAELDEGNIWEAILDGGNANLGNVMWVVDLNRQSLDRVVPGIKVASLSGMFAEAGWHVTTAKYGQRLQSFFNEPGGDDLREWIDHLPNDDYQSLISFSPSRLRQTLTTELPSIKELLKQLPDCDLAALLGDLGGHDLQALTAAYRECDAERNRPSIVFAYTVKGFGTPMVGDPLNHSALLTVAQIDELRRTNGLFRENEWSTFPAGTPESVLCASVAERLSRDKATPTEPTNPTLVPRAVTALAKRGSSISTQEAFGRSLTGLARSRAAPRIVTVSPDVSVSTNLGGWINKVGVYTHQDQSQRRDDAAGRALRWDQSPQGRHIELGISEMNFFSLIGALGTTTQTSSELLLPIGTVYDPFVCRGLDALIYGLYNGGKFVIAGTPSGVSLAAEGGAHQSSITVSIGLELPGICMAEPAYATAVDWLLCDALQSIAADHTSAESLYLRLSTLPQDQTPFADAAARLGEDTLREAVLAGGYLLVDPGLDAPCDIQLAGSGAVMPSLVVAAAELNDEGLRCAVIDVTSLDRLYRDWIRSRRDRVGALRARRRASYAERLLRPGVPVVTVHDAASHAMAWLGSVHGVKSIPLGVDRFGQSGTVAELHRHFEIDNDAIINAALLLAAGD
jgi:pyruvate dehydrogenase E1 component